MSQASNTSVTSKTSKVKKGSVTSNKSKTSNKTKKQLQEELQQTKMDKQTFRELVINGNLKHAELQQKMIDLQAKFKKQGSENKDLKELIVQMAKGNVKNDEQQQESKEREKQLTSMNENLLNLLWSMYQDYQILFDDLIEDAKGSRSRKISNLIANLQERNANITAATRDQIQSEMPQYQAIEMARVFNEEAHRIRMKKKFSKKQEREHYF